MVDHADEVLVKSAPGGPAVARGVAREPQTEERSPCDENWRFLRQTSLDELPQIWNVIRGEMSLVGPRPIVRLEVARYAEEFDLYRKVRPGMTGLWQVSGRSETTY